MIRQSGEPHHGEERGVVEVRSSKGKKNKKHGTDLVRQATRGVSEMWEDSIDWSVRRRMCWRKNQHVVDDEACWTEIAVPWVHNRSRLGGTDGADKHAA